MSKKTVKPEGNLFAKAAQALMGAAETLAKGAIDLDAKDYESGDIDQNDTKVRRHKRRNSADSGNGYSGMVPTEEEESDMRDDGGDGHRTIVTGRDHVRDAQNDDYEDPEDADVGDDEWYEHTHAGAKHNTERNPNYRKSENEEDEDEGEEEDRKEKKEHKKSRSAETDSIAKSAEAEVYEQLLESPDFAEIVESSAVVEHIADVMGKSFGEVFGEVESIKKGMLAIMKSQHTILEALANTPVSNVAPGVIGMIGNKPITLGGQEQTNQAPAYKGNMVGADAVSKAWRSENFLAIEKAVSDGEVNPDLLTRFDVDANVIKLIPEVTRTKYGIKLPN